MLNNTALYLSHCNIMVQQSILILHFVTSYQIARDFPNLTPLWLLS